MTVWTRETLTRLIYDEVKADVESEAQATSPFQEGYAVGFNDCRYRVIEAILAHGVGELDGEKK